MIHWFIFSYATQQQDSDNRCPVFYPLFLILYSASFSLLLIHFR